MIALPDRMMNVSSTCILGTSSVIFYHEGAKAETFLFVSLWFVPHLPLHDRLIRR